MHPARIFTVEDRDALLAHIAAHPFIALAAAPGGRPLLAHTPVVIRRFGDDLALDFHLSRMNPLSSHLERGFEGVMLAMGPDAYVSPDWYESADQVPTWNYVTVEVEGPVAALPEAGLVAFVDDLAVQEEGRLAPKPPWTRAKMTTGRFETMLKAIVGARMTVRRLEGTTKLSQNKTAADRAGVIAALGDHPVGQLMAWRERG